MLLGLRYAFNQPRPAPVAAVAPAPAAPAPARTYLVFFDWDRADLTDRARQIIADAAQNARRVQTTRIEVSGHADRTGTAAYNQRLSVRRAEAVAGELVRNGETLDLNAVIESGKATSDGGAYSLVLEHNDFFWADLGGIIMARLVYGRRES